MISVLSVSTFAIFFLRGKHQISGKGSGQFFCVGFFFGSFGAARDAGIILVVALLHDFFFLIFCLARFLFW